MNFYILVIVAVCFTAYNAAAENEFCNNCNGMCFPFPHPKRCDAFLNCNHGTYQEFFCGRGICYDETLKVCGICNTCEKSCEEGEKFWDYFSCYGYFECKNNVFNSELKKCSDGEKFNKLTSTCEKDMRCRRCPYQKTYGIPGKYKQLINGVWEITDCPLNKEFSSLTCSCSKTLKYCSDDYKLSNEIGTFYQNDSSGWILQKCGKGLAFNMTTCTCSDSYTINNTQNDCMAINLPLNGSVDDINNHYVANTNVDFVENSAFFNGSSKLVLLATKNNDFRSKLDVSFQIRIPDEFYDMAILSNDNCKSAKNTYSIYLKKDINFPKLVVFMQIDGNNNSITMESEIQSGWMKIKVSKQHDKLILFVGGLKKAEKIISGNIKRNDCAITIGTMNNKENFKGYMKEFLLDKCPDQA